MFITSPPRRLPAFIILHALCSLWLSGLATADEYVPRTDPKFQQVELVYRNLVRAVGDSRTAPELRMVRGKSSVFDIARFAPKLYRVAIEERFVNLAQRLPASDGPPAVAAIPVHDLPHHDRP